MKVFQVRISSWTRKAGTFVMLPAFLALALPLLASAAPRAIPKPMPSHPGNIFLSGEEISILAPAGQAPAWQLLDYDGKVVAQGMRENNRVKLGRQAPGYYELQQT